MISVSISHNNVAMLFINGDDVSQNHRSIRLFSQDGTNRGGDISFRKSASSHLIKERLEKVVIRLID